ncbi:hypothetical protein [uncultured Mediterranean phage uvMED]|nr:hypothetical protein [uncultured Mediterranean phage uvMED]
MTTTISAKLNNDAREFQTNNSTGFSFSLGEQYYNRKTKAKEWTNYQFSVFASNPNQIDYLRLKLVKGSVVSATALTLRIEEFNGRLFNVGDNCSVKIIYSSEGQSQQRAPQAAPQAHDDFDDSIPF